MMEAMVSAMVINQELMVSASLILSYTLSTSLQALIQQHQVIERSVPVTAISRVPSSLLLRNDQGELLLHERLVSTG